MATQFKNRRFHDRAEKIVQGVEVFTTSSSALLSEIASLLRDYGTKKPAVLIEGSPGSGKRTLAAHLFSKMSGGNHAAVFIQCHPKLKSRDILRMARYRQARYLYLDNVDQLSQIEWQKLCQILVLKNFWIIASIECPWQLVRSKAVFGKTISVPPLRRRPDDVPLIAMQFSRRWRDLKFSQEALEVLREYTWPGEVTQLVFCVAKVCRHVSSLGHDMIRRVDVEGFLEMVPPLQNYFDLIPPQGSRIFYEYAKRNGLKSAIASFEAIVIANAVLECSGSYASAARVLNLPVTTLESRIKSLRSHLFEVTCLT